MLFEEVRWERSMKPLAKVSVQAGELQGDLPPQYPNTPGNHNTTPGTTAITTVSPNINAR